MLTTPREFGTDVVRYSGCNDFDTNTQVVFLDRHNVQCNSDEVLAEVRVVSTDCTGSNKQYRAVCRPLASSAGTRAARADTTSCNTVDVEDIAYLDRHNLACSTGEALSSFKLDESPGGTSCSGLNRGYNYGCWPFSTMLPCY